MKKALAQLLLNAANLLKIKSLVTMILTLVMALVVMGEIVIPAEVLALFSTAYGAVMTYFFTRKDDAK